MGLPLRAADRGDAAPLILAGGPTATHPEPLAPFIDAFFIGEAEEALPPLVREAAALRRAGVPRRERLIRLAEKFPLYVPELYPTELDGDSGLLVVGAPLDPRVPARPRRALVDDINRFPFPDDSPLPYAEAIFDRMAVEVARGCTEGCRFCQAGMIYRPVRERDPVAVLDALTNGVKKGGYDETALTSLSMADYSCVTPLVKAAMAKLGPEKVSLSVSSLRAYGLNDDLLGEIAGVRAGGLTFAPEAGTQRMRDVIAKNVTEADIIESAHRVFGRGFSRMKLYFMIGLPTETDEDVAGIVETAARVQAIGRQHQRGAQVTASVSTHVPKPHTPFQWAAMDSEAETTRKQGILAERARALRVNLKMHENQQSHIEGIFARGDRRAGELLEAAYRLGCRFDSWDDVLRIDLWEQAMAATAPRTGFDGTHALGTLPVTARLPWSHIDIGLEPDFLAKEYRKALKDRLSPPCGKPYKKLLHPASVAAAEAGAKDKLICYDCGVACDLDAMKGERLFYLRRMNAWGGAVVAAPVEVAEASPAKPRPVQDPTRPPPRALQGTPHGYRLRYTKLGRVAYLGHLDLVRHLPRIFRRAGFEIYLLGRVPPQAGPVVRPGARARDPLAGRDPRREAGRRRSARRARAPSPPRLAGRDRHPRGRAPRRQRPRARPRHHGSGVRGAPAGRHRPRRRPRAVRRRRAAQGAARIGQGDRAHRRRAQVAAVAIAVRGRRHAARGSAGPTAPLVSFAVSVSHEGSAQPSEVITTLFGDDVAHETELARLALWAATSGRDPLRVSEFGRAHPSSRGGGRRGRGAVIETVGLTKRFGETLAVDDLTLRIEAGEVMGFLGPNGSGKTTTIRLLMGLLRPSAGRAVDPRSRLPRRRRRAQARRRLPARRAVPLPVPLGPRDRSSWSRGLHGFAAR